MPTVQKTILAFLLCILFLDVWGQDLNPLLRRLNEAHTNEDRIFTLHELATACWEFDYEKGHEFAKQALLLAEEDEFVNGQEISLRDIGIYNFLSGNYPVALLKFKESISLNAEVKNRINTLIHIGNVFSAQAEYDSASDYFQQAYQLLQKDKANRNWEFYLRSLGEQNIHLMNSSDVLMYLHSAISYSKKNKDSLVLAKDYTIISEAYLQLNNFDSAAYYLAASKELAYTIKSQDLAFLNLIGEAKLFEEQARYPESIRAYEEAYEGLEIHKLMRYKGIVLSGMGRVFERIGEYEMALEKYLQALAILEKLGDRYEAGRVYAQSAWAYFNQRNYEKVIEVTDQALSIFKKINHPPRISYVYNLKGLLAFRNKEIEKSLAYYDSALVIRKDIDNKLYYYHTLNNIAQVYIQTGNHEIAMEFLKQAAEGELMLLDYFNLATTYNNMASLYLKMENRKEAEKFLFRAETIAKKYKHAAQLSKTYKMLGDYYKQSRQFEKASNYFELYSVLNDSIYDKNLQDRVDRLHAVYDLEIKEKEIISLSQQKELAEKEASNQRLTIRNQRYFIFFTASSILLLIVLLFTLYRYYKEKDKANHYLEQLNREISEQKEEIQTQAEELTEANNSLFSITEQLQIANEKVQETNAELENLVQTRTQELRKAYIELDTFFYRASHDFRRPITTFLGLAEVAKMTIKDQTALELFANVRDTARSLDRMIIKLNAVSDIGSHQLVFKEVLLKEIVNDVVDVFQDKIRSTNIKIIDHVKVDKLVLSYPALVRIIIENLVENAIDFRIPENPMIEISAHADDDAVIFEIKDNGQGVDEEYLPKIFEMYFRGNINSKGNGLGLYVVKKAVDKIGAHINFESEKYKGTSVTITFPLNVNQVRSIS